MSAEALDARSVANTIIRVADEFDLPLSHLSLQKILYFIHGTYLSKTGTPLISGYFEAWQYGPVHPVIFASFKEAGAARLRQKAKVRDLISGVQEEVQEPTSPSHRAFITKMALHFLHVSPGRLVDLSHAPNSPWDALTRTPSGSRAFGMRMTNEDIATRFRHHKVSVGLYPKAGEPYDESPPS
jgi:uncharacterized phage-associated protein